MTVDEARRETISKRLRQALSIVDECVINSRGIDEELREYIARAGNILNIAIREVEFGVHSA